MLRTPKLRTRLAVGLWVLLAGVLAPTALAQRQGGLQDRFRSGQDVVVPAGETVSHDLYVAGGRIRVDGRVEGDLVAAGGQLEINGPVLGDLAVAGGQVTVAGPIQGDVRAAGGQVEVSGAVGEDLLAAAGSLMLPRLRGSGKT